RFLPGKAADDSRRRSRCFPHCKSGRGRQRVYGRQQGDMQWMTIRVLFAAEIDEGRDACDSDCGIEHPFTPNAAERVRYDHTTSQLTGKFICRLVGIIGE